jgi:methionine sulfoxide reductase catalytic subunit
MLIKIPRGWEIPERLATPEHVYLNRRNFLAGASAAALGGIAGLLPGAGLRAAGPSAPGSPELAPLKAPRNSKYKVDHPITSEMVATRFNNYYEFTEVKNEVWQLAQNFHARPWQIEIKGEVEKHRKVDVDELIRQMPLEERLYHHRCVEAWTIYVPWIGFPMKKFVEWCTPTSKARYVRMVSYFRPSEAVGQARATWYPWPYYEGLTMEEATNELALLVVGMYGKMLPNQNGAPIRLHTPWKYGYKSIKGITQFEFTSKQPSNFWNAVVPAEYDFWANVNPNKPHPRWSQATERLVETGERIPTQMYNGYGEYVAYLYK